MSRVVVEIREARFVLDSETGWQTVDDEPTISAETILLGLQARFGDTWRPEPLTYTADGVVARAEDAVKVFDGTIVSVETAPYVPGRIY